MASGTDLAATAAADPPEDPPGTRSGSHGFFTGRYAEFSFDDPIPNSSQFVFPTTTAPAATRRFTHVALSAATKPARIFEPAVEGSVFTWMLSFTASGTPASGRFSPSSTSRSTSGACASARSSANERYEPWRSAAARTRARAFPATSTAVTCRSRTARASSAAGPSRRRSTTFIRSVVPRHDARDDEVPVREFRGVALGEPQVPLGADAVEPQRRRRRVRGVRQLRIRDRPELFEVLDDPRQLAGQLLRPLGRDLERGQASHLRDERRVDLHAAKYIR